MYRHETGEPSKRPHEDVFKKRPTLFATDAATCPKCLGPIEPERLPSAKLCLDCNVVR